MSSLRERSRRLNMGVFISGASGTGKSRMTERLAASWRRVIYVDPMRSFTTATVTAWPDAAASLATFWRSSDARMNFGVSFTSDTDYARFFGALSALMRQMRGQNPNFLLVVDEVDLWSGPKYLDTHLSHIFRYGRHYGCSWIANCRADVHTNRDVRMNAAEILLFRQGMLSPEMKSMLVTASLQRDDFPDTLSALPDVWKLTPHGPDEPALAEEHRHFIAVPYAFDAFLPQWHALATGA